MAVGGQFYAAGLAIFGATSFVPHAVIGWSFIILSVILVVATLSSRARRSLAGPAVGILLLAIAQPIIVFGLRRWPLAAATHPLVGLAIAGLLLLVSRRAAQAPARS